MALWNGRRAAARPARRFALHASVVEVDGRAVVLRGRRGAGKSTTALALAGSRDDDLGGEGCAAGVYYALGRIGTRVWNRLAEPVSLGDLCETMCSEYDVEAATCRRDVESFVGQLRDAGLIEAR